MASKAYQIAFDGEAVEDDFYADVLSVTAEESTDRAGLLRLKLATQLGEDGAWSLLDDARFGLFKPVTLKLGFLESEGVAGALSGLGGAGGDSLTPVFDGYITGFEFKLGSRPGETHIELTAMDTSVLLSLEEKIARWVNLSDSDIARQILSAYGVQVEADSTPVVHQENGTTILQRSSDLQFVRELARRNGLEFYFETEAGAGQAVACFRAPQLDGTPQPDLAVQFGEESNLESFSARLTGLFPLAVKTAQTDVKTASAQSAQASTTSRTALGASDASALVGAALGRLVTPADSLSQALLLGSPSSDTSELQAAAQAMLDEASWIIWAEGEVNTEAYGALLRPRRLVLIKGAGPSYGGKYYVTRVTHELSSDGSWRQKFQARRNARDLDGSEQFGRSALGLSAG